MEIVEETTERGVVERRFDLNVDGEIVPGIHWLPEGEVAPHPTVLIGHGGSQHKRVPNVLGLARTLVRHCGYGAVALDAPGHGDRMTEAQRQARAELLTSRQEGRPVPASFDRARALDMFAPKAVAEWKALLDDLASNAMWAAGPYGYWGVSMGTAFGVPLLAVEPRISAAVLGLGALRSDDDVRRTQAASITIPILFLFQSDDELMTREGGLALWDSFGSSEKTLHLNPGPHVGVPLFERQAAVAFFRRHFEPATTEAAPAT
ncbi:MAG: alpha/beta hydrolase [Acidimicrobiales bacterium]